MAYLGLKEDAKAADDARRALSLEPTFVKASFRLATALKNLKRSAEACKALQA